MNMESQFQLVEPKSQPVCRFCWREFHEFTSKLAKNGNIAEECIRQLASTWVRNNYSSVPLAFYFAIFIAGSSYWLVQASLLMSILTGFIALVTIAFLRSIIGVISYKKLSETEVQEILNTIATNNDVEVRQLHRYVAGKLHELYLWRQFPRGLGLVVATMYTAIALKPNAGALVGIGVWLIMSIIQYRLWCLGHIEQSELKFTLDDKTDIWNFFGLFMFLTAFSILRWVISTSALAVAIYRIGSNEFAVDFSLLFLLFIINLIISLRNDVV
jgi:hypothetical protein